MRIKYFFLFFIFVSFWSCNKDDEDYEFVDVAVAEIMSKSVFRKSVEITDPKAIDETGKIYVYKDYIFVSDVNKGIHVIDNSNPSAPTAIKFIQVIGNEDISVKGDFLYADSATDLLVFDISDINNVTFKERLEDVFDIYDYQIPADVRELNYGEFNYDTDIIIGWTVVTERREKVDERAWIDVDIVMSDGTETPNSTGQGGSLARFKIVEDYLYAVGSYSMTIFDIEDLSTPELKHIQYAGWNIETLFHADGYLYLGSTNGMYIYNLENPELPEYVSEFTHWEGCDPVVVDGDYAYLTLRGGNACGQLESVLEVIDVSEKIRPVLKGRYTLDNPYGLGIKANTLFVCDGTSGLKLFDKEDPLNLSLVKQFKGIQAKDVIPLEDKLIMIGDGIIYQYSYVSDGLELLSSYSLQ